MEAETNTPLRPGQQLKLRVEQRGETTLLRVVPQQSEPREVQTRALRAALPRQTPLPPLLANLMLLTKAPEQVPHQSAPAWANLARALVRALPEPQTLAKPDGLRSAMSNSGTFFEARAARAAGGNAPFPAQDFKAGLLRLVGLLSREGPLPPAARPSRASGPTPATLPQTTPATPAGSPRTAATPGASPKSTAPPAGPPQPGPANEAPRPAVFQSPQPQTPSQPTAQARPARGAAPVEGASPPPRHGPPQPQHSVSASIGSLSGPAKITTELRGQLEGALSRVQIHQLNSLSADEGVKPLWSMEIPVRRGEQVDVWSLRIEEEGAAPAEAPDKRWSVSLAFELESLGPVHARLTLQHQRISASLWAENESTAALIGRHAEDLRQMLDAAGLSVGDVLCVHGRPSRTTDMTAPSSLISVEA